MENIRACGSICHSLSVPNPAGSGLRPTDLLQWPICADDAGCSDVHILFMPVACQCAMQKCVFHRCRAGNLHLMCIQSDTTYANCHYACAMFRLSSLFLGTVLSMCVCVCLWLPGLLLFCSNGEHVVITVIYHNDGLALPPQRKQKLAAA